MGLALTSTKKLAGGFVDAVRAAGWDVDRGVLGAKPYRYTYVRGDASADRKPPAEDGEKQAERARKPDPKRNKTQTRPKEE